MADLLVYWRDCRHNLEAVGALPLRHWHSNARVMAELQPGDRLWMVASGASIGVAPAYCGFLVEVWRVAEASINRGEDAAYPAHRFRHRVTARVDETLTPGAPLDVDAVIRPCSFARERPIGQALQGPRRLPAEKVEQLLAVIGRPAGSNDGRRAEKPGFFEKPGFWPDSAQAPKPRRRKPHESDAGGSAAPDAKPNHELPALGIRQPWAELILRGEKRIEVRTLPTNVRGTIYLYASRKVSDHPASAAAARKCGIETESLTRGRLVGTVEIVDSRPCVASDAAAACLAASQVRGKQAWILERPCRLSEPLPVRFLPYGVWFYPFRRRNGGE